MKIFRNEKTQHSALFIRYDSIMTTHYNIEEVPDKKEKKKLLDAIEALIPEPIP